MTWMKLKENNCGEWKLRIVYYSTPKKGMSGDQVTAGDLLCNAASQLPGEWPMNVDDAPAP